MTLPTGVDYVANFPDNFQNQDFWKICEQYGVVSNVYLIIRDWYRRFGCVWLLKVIDQEMLVWNLCAIWIDKNGSTAQHVICEQNKQVQDQEIIRNSRSFASVLKGKKATQGGGVAKGLGRTIKLVERDLLNVLDASCVVFVNACHANLIANLYKVCRKEGFLDLEIKRVFGSAFLTRKCF